jgi:hypothetical protein
MRYNNTAKSGDFNVSNTLIYSVKHNFTKAQLREQFTKTIIDGQLIEFVQKQIVE